MKPPTSPLLFISDLIQSNTIDHTSGTKTAFLPGHMTSSPFSVRFMVLNL